MKEPTLYNENMEDKEIKYFKGLTQAEYIQNKIQLKDFEPVESDWEELFRWVMSVGRKVEFCDKDGNEGNISDLWRNHIITVLVEIECEDTKREKASFIRKVGIDNFRTDTGKLGSKIQNWMERIDKYICTQAIAEEATKRNSALEIATSVKEQLEQSLISKRGGERGGSIGLSGTEAGNYCNMWQAVNEIKNKWTYYLQEIEAGGNMDPGLSLLLIFIRNYSTVMKGFNQRFSALPEFYYDQILKVSPRKTIQDKAFLAITPSDPAKGLTLPAQTQFIGGEQEDGTQLLYQTEKDEFVSGMQIAKAFTIFQKKEMSGGKIKRTFHKQPIDIHSALPTVLFSEDDCCSEYTFGWMVESAMFVLKEGEATIDVSFQLTAAAAARLSGSHFSPDELLKAFTIYVSDSKGWSRREHKVNYAVENGKGILTFKLEKCEIKDPWIPATNELHHVKSVYPMVRILSCNENSPYDLMKQVKFDEVRIHLDVKHIRNINAFNESGEIDTSKPFYPFGPLAEQGTWLRFGNEEIYRKNLTSLELSGTWNRLPQTKSGYIDVYKNWYLDSDNIKPILKIKNDSFKIECKYFANEKWGKCTVLNPDNNLFQFLDENKNILSEKASIKMEFPDTTHSSGTISNGFSDTGGNAPDSERICPFRVTLAGPDIGFGPEEYRNIFAERMVIKNKTPESPLPAAPIIPVWADMELAYMASASLDLSRQEQFNNSSVRLYRVTDLFEYELNPIGRSKDQPFVLEPEDEQILFLSFSNGFPKKTIRMYFDLVFLKKDLFKEEERDPDEYPALEWYYLYDGRWVLLESEYLLEDETCGFTQRGYIEIEYPGGISEKSLDKHRSTWLKVHLQGDPGDCLALRRIYMDYIPVTAKNGDGSPLPAMTIKQPKAENPGIDHLLQPLPGYGGKAMETKERSSVRQSARIGNRNRALNSLDYEQLILDRFPDIGKVCCLPPEKYLEETNPTSDVNIVVFSYTEDNIYPVTPAWKLSQIKKYITKFISPYARVKVINPSYESVEIECIATVRTETTENDEIMQRITDCIHRYYAAWIQNRTFPELGKCYSYKALYSLLSNDKDMVKIYELTINGKKMEDIDVDKQDLFLCGKTPWSVLIPDKTDLRLLLHNGGIKNFMIEYNFLID